MASPPARPVRRRIGLAFGWAWVAIAMLFLVIALNQGWDRSGDTVASTPAGTLAMRAAIDPFVHFASASASELPSMNLSHDYTAEGLRRLADALAALGRSSAAADAARRAADAITVNPRARDHAASVRRAFDAAAGALGALSPGYRTRLEALANAIDPELPLLQQEPHVRDFFAAAGRAVDAVA